MESGVGEPNLNEKPNQNVEPKVTDVEAAEEIPHGEDVAVDDAAFAQKTTGKKKRNKKKKTKKVFSIPEQDNSVFRCLNNWPAVEESVIDSPPTIPIEQAYSGASFPLGEVVTYPQAHNSFRQTDAEKRDLERILTTDYEALRHAAECHRQVRKYVQSFIRPGIKLIDMCQKLEAKTKELINAEGLQRGFGFPTGCSLNNVAAHYTPNYGDETELKADDVMKIDFGVHVGGRIIDCAWTVAFNPKYDPLIKATQDATNTGLKAAGIDVPFSEIGTAIHEVIESYEMELDGKVVQLKPVANLNGHSIGPYRVHADKSLPIVRNSLGVRMEEGELYAIETFATTGRGHVNESGECSHYMVEADIGHVPLRVNRTKALYNAIQQHFGTLAFCRRWLDDVGQTRHQLALKQLVDAGIVRPYPPLVDMKGSFISQMEHTVLLRPTCKEILSRGSDY